MAMCFGKETHTSLRARTFTQSVQRVHSLLSNISESESLCVLDKVCRCVIIGRELHGVV